MKEIETRAKSGESILNKRKRDEQCSSPKRRKPRSNIDWIFY
jgi:hypothetical protein